MMNGPTDNCFKYQREGHYASNCYVTKYDNKQIISDDKEVVYVCEYCNKEYETDNGARCRENL